MRTVMNGDDYFYAVSAVNAEGEGARSDEASATPAVAATAPAAPANFAVAPGDAAGEIDLTWDAVRSDWL